MERVVIVAYRPKPGMDRLLETLVQKHWGLLNDEGLVSERKPIFLKSEEGEILEIFGWKSKEAINLAHHNANVQSLWSEFAEVCDYIPASEVSEIGSLFSEFEVVL